MSHTMFQRVGGGKVGIDPTAVASFEDGTYKDGSDKVDCVWVRFKNETHRAVAVVGTAEEVAKSFNMKQDKTT